MLQQEYGMSTQHSPLSLHRLTFVSPLNQDLVADYLAHLRSRHYSPKTLQTTLGALVTFYRLLPPARQPRLWQDITRLTPADVDAWLQTAQRKGLAPSTLHNLLSVVRRFCTFLQEQELLAHHPIHPRRHEILVPQVLPRPMMEDDLIRFFQVIDVLRDRTLFLLMLRCGLRVGEATTLPWAAIDWTQGTIRVNNSKGRVDRIVYISPDLEKVLRQWRRAQWPPMPCLFPSASRPPSPVSIRSIQRVMGRYLKAAGLTRRYSPHTLRHTFATQLLNAGTSLEVVKELMGHRSITMTLRYAQVYETTKRTQYTQAMAQIELRQAL
jgi:site-specific recombinase XerD